MLKLYYLLLIFTFATTNLYPQQITVYGHLRDSITHFPIVGGVITNVNSKKKVSTDAKGSFSIQAAPNDFLYVLAKSYRYDTLTFSFLFTDTLTISLSPAANILPTVTVRTQYSKYQMDSVRRREEFEESHGKQLKAVSKANNLGFGLALNLDRIFKEKYKNKNRSEDVYSAVEKSLYIDYRYSPHVVAYYTGFKGDRLRSFMERFTPDYKWLRTHPTNEDVMYYINDKLREFKASN